MTPLILCNQAAGAINESSKSKEKFSALIKEEETATANVSGYE